MPELLPIALLFRGLGGRVVYEVQENLRLKFDRKPRNKHRFFQLFFGWFDQLARRYCYFVFTEDSYRTEYTNLRLPHAVVHNFPNISNLTLDTQDSLALTRRLPNSPTINIGYLGLITLDRGLDTMLAVLAQLKTHYPSVKLHLFGRLNIDQAGLRAIAHYESVSNDVIFYGHVDQRIALENMAHWIVGFALLKPVGDYPRSYPTKLFEYMALGIPVITSNMPLYQSVIETHHCGFCVDPTDVDGITRQIIWLIEHPEEAEQIGNSGRQVAILHFDWQKEANKLLELYK